MQSPDQQVLAAIRRWRAQGHRVALVTVARTWGSAPRPPGAWLALRDDALVQGSVSGGCIEDDLIARMRSGWITGDRPLRVDYGITRREAERFGLPCGGALELIVEPAPAAAALAELEQRIAAGERVRRTLHLADGAVTLGDGAGDAVPAWDGDTLVTLHGPCRRLLLIGAGPIATYLAPMAQALDYAVTVCDPREDYCRAWQVPGTRWLSGMPDDAVLAMRPDCHTAIVALTHDPRLDDLALVNALRSPAFYVGALGSRTTSAERKERLHRHCELRRDEVERLHGPVGLPIGSRTPPEIAVSILAEMTAVKQGVRLVRTTSDQARTAAGPAPNRADGLDGAPR